MMTDARERALAAALEYWRHVDPACYTATMMAGDSRKQGGSYGAKDVVRVAGEFLKFLDGQKPR